MGVINLDHNATTPLHPAAAAAMRQVEAEAPGNPASAHSLGRKARRFLEDARERVAQLLDARAAEVIFTSGATEANNLALFGLAGASPGRIISSRIEHASVIEPLQVLERRGFAVEWLPVGPDGRVAAERVGDGRAVPARLVAVMLVNHETGVVQDVAALAGAAPVHCDAAQAVGKMPVSFRKLSVTTLSLSAHKFGGPKGAGALLVRAGAELEPQMFGGHQQRDLRPGTESASLAVGLATALEQSVAEMAARTARWRSLRAHFLARLAAEVPPIVVNGEGLPGTVNVAFPGCRADALLMALDLAGVACSTGSACSSGSLLPSPVLRAMGVPAEVLGSAMRFSFGAETPDLDIAIERITACVRQVREH